MTAGDNNRPTRTISLKISSVVTDNLGSDAIAVSAKSLADATWEMWRQNIKFNNKS